MKWVGRREKSVKRESLKSIPGSSKSLVVTVSTQHIHFLLPALEDKLFKVWVTVLDNGVDSFPQEIELDEQLKTMDKKDDLQDTPKLAQYQWNCCYFRN